MDFDYTPQEETFRNELRAWLAANPLDGYDPVTFPHLSEDERFAIQMHWQKQLHRGGWVGIHWPKAYGGRGADVVKQAETQVEGRGGDSRDSSARQHVAQFYAELQAITSLRQLTRQLRGEPPGPESSLVKLAASELNQRIVLFATALFGPASQVFSDTDSGIDGQYWTHCALNRVSRRTEW